VRSQGDRRSDTLPDELPALAFCLLFRFQGAEALAHPAQRTGHRLGACAPLGGRNLRGAENNTTRPDQGRQPVSEEFRRGDVTSVPSAAGGTCRAGPSSSSGGSL